MTRISAFATATAVASLLLMGAASAQTAAPAAKTEAPKADAKAPAEKKAEKPRSEVSIQCSKDADAKGLHGKERKKFHKECVKEAKGGTDKPAADKK